MSFVQRFSSDAGNACDDLYSRMILGDDAGKSARLTLVLRPKALPLRYKGPVRIDLGMTFLEINNRAYVKSVAPGSVAAKAGVQPQDAVQYATLLQPEWLPDHDEQPHPELDDETAENDIASQRVQQLESKGLRISYDELRQLLAEAMDPTQSAFLSPPTARWTAKNAASTWNGPPIPATVNICVPVPHNPNQLLNNNEDGSDGIVMSSANNNAPYSGDMPRPVVFCFRRTRQRKSRLYVARFRLDDECDFASSLVRRLAPTADMETPPPDTWEELVHDGTDWLLGRGSMLPPKRQQQIAQQQEAEYAQQAQHLNGNENTYNDDDDDPSHIPLDAFEKVRAQKLAQLRSRMAAEFMQIDRSDDVEAVTIRSMIQKAVGLAFVRSNKVVLGLSFHAGSGIVVARLSDGTWSAPSAIGTWGVGLGIQFGLEVAEYIFILQTQEALDHFKRGGSFTIGGNMGVAIAGIGREAYGAASVGGACGAMSDVKDDEYNDNDSREERNQHPRSVGVAPIVAYAKSQGLYIGVSLEGSRIYARDDINRRTYKFTCGRDLTAHDILSGKIPTPHEAEELYAALHSVEFAHEMSCLPRPPEVLRRDSAHAWFYDRSTLADQVSQSLSSSSGSSAGESMQQQKQKGARDPFPFLSSLSPDETEDCETFETQFKNFMYGGVSVQRLLPPDAEGHSGLTGKERRTLWLMLPEVGSLRLGFVSKLSDGEGAVSNKSSTQRARRDDPTGSRLSTYDGDVGTVGSEDVTLDSALNTRDGSTIAGHIRTGNVQLSNRHSVALTDVTVLSQEPLVPVRFKIEDKMEHLRVISIQDVAGSSLLFLANNFREAELLVCGLKLLLERETARLGVRGGLPLSAFGARNLEGAMSPSAARGFRDMPRTATNNRRKESASNRAPSSGYISSDAGEGESVGDSDAREKALPDSRRAWGNVPGRNYMRKQAATVSSSSGNGLNELGVPHYVHGHQVIRDIARNVRLPLPLPLCRVLLLDATSPVIHQWEDDRGDKNFDIPRWSFPPGTPRELERHSSEHQLIASGGMCGAYRTLSFDRPRYGSIVRLTETHAVDADDSKKLLFTVDELNPRRGFQICVRVLLRAYKDNACDASVIAEIRPVGKDMSNQAAVHKAFLLVLDEIKHRYGTEGSGLVAGFLKVVDSMTADGGSKTNGGVSSVVPRLFHRTGPVVEEKKENQPSRSAPRKEDSKSGLVSFDNMLKTSRQSPETLPSSARPSTPSVSNAVPEANPAKRLNGGRVVQQHDEPDDLLVEENRLIEVKPLPKIRLSLMPSPREEDEEDLSSSSQPPDSKLIKKKKKKRRSLRGSMSKKQPRSPKSNINGRRND